MRGNKNGYIIQAGVIAAIYYVLTVVLKPISYGAVQFRLSEAMTILPFYMPEAIPGLFLGCMLANIFGGLGLIDIVFGSLTTLAAAYLTSKMPNKYLAVIPPILLNAFIVSIWVSKITNMPYVVTVGTIGFGEFVSAGIAGIILSTVIERVTNLYKH
ncbi:QueT transporter family protein [Caloramator sp. E03]|uniref:QueT transporter family protein n=1 Tax=Caloramator sp. E03 TaxID=2576307 RepID=UPI00111065F7|nr:QueT transporter family protein [Caloramator sp. E03]QCX32729.1 QueT transporter family protein [Caloramator sp. E03]